MAHAIFYTYQNSGMCAGMCMCDHMHQMEKTVILTNYQLILTTYPLRMTKTEYVVVWVSHTFQPVSFRIQDNGPSGSVTEILKILDVMYQLPKLSLAFQFYLRVYFEILKIQTSRLLENPLTTIKSMSK